MAGPPQKHPRHRHTDAQLAALNDLYDHDDSPPLVERAALAHSLGMEPKAVNAWFANKRSASKKKSRGLIALDHPYINSPQSLSASGSPHPPSHSNHHHHNDNNNDTRHSTPMYYRHPSPYQADVVEAHQLDSCAPSFDGHNAAAFDNAPRRMRVRPTPEQREELERIFEHNTHPSREERETLGERIGMRYQTVTNWFQNMRSVSKKRLMEDDMDAQSVHSAVYSDYGSVGHHEHAARPPSYPSGASHPSLASAISTPSGVTHASSHTHYSAPPHAADNPSAYVRRSDTATLLARPRRSRPEPYQLAALRKLFNRTQNPSIEERGALALEINMDIGKVTNWFRNLRQTARKRAMKVNEDEESVNDYDSASGPVSRASTPPLSRFSSSNSHRNAYPESVSSSTRSRSSASGDDEAEHVMDVDRYTRSGRPSQHPSHPHARSISLRGPAAQRPLPPPRQHHHQHHHSDGASEDDYEEAVTPPPAPAPVPPPPVNVAPVARVVTSGRNRMDVGFLTGSSEDVRSAPPVMVKQENMHVEAGSPKVEDAMLLLGFSRTVQ